MKEADPASPFMLGAYGEAGMRVTKANRELGTGYKSTASILGKVSECCWNKAFPGNFLSRHFQ
jgi:hypothetical protein